MPGAVFIPSKGYEAVPGDEGNSFTKPKKQAMANNLKPSWLDIHQAIHDGSDSVTFGRNKLPVTISPINGCRCVRYQDIDLGGCVFIEQNKRKLSRYAERARNGETLTWVIPDNKAQEWRLIDKPVKQKA